MYDPKSMTEQQKTELFNTAIQEAIDTLTFIKEVAEEELEIFEKSSILGQVKGGESILKHAVNELREATISPVEEEIQELQEQIDNSG